MGDVVHWISAEVIGRVPGAAVKTLESYFERHRLAEGMPKAQFVSTVLPRLSVHLTDHYLGILQSSGAVLVETDSVLLPDRRVKLSDAESRAVGEILDILGAGGLTPPAGDELRRALSPTATGAFEPAVAYLTGTGKVLRLSNHELLSAEAVHEAQKDLLDEGVESVTVKDFKDRFGLTRKWAIPLLEHLDSVGFTRRVGDKRLINHRR